MARITIPDLVQRRWEAITKGVRDGLSANRILQTLRDAGIGIGRTAGLGQIRTAKGARDQQTDAAALDWQNPIPPNFPTPWPKGTRTDYGVVVKIIGTNRVTGEQIEFHHTTYTTDLISPGEAINDALDAYSDPRYTDQFSLDYGYVKNVLQFVPAVV